MPIFTSNNKARLIWALNRSALPFAIILLCLCLLFSSAVAEIYKNPIDNTLQMAQQGDVTAQIELATAYEHGEGIDKNSEQAIQWYCKAALNGSTTAQRNLAWMFLNARGIERDEALAVRWFLAAAQSGDEFSKNMLSRLDTQQKTNKTICIKPVTPVWETRRCSKRCRQIVNKVKKIAPRYNIESRLVLALIQQESNFNTRAVSHKGATGLMQLMPDTAKRFGVKDINDPNQNIKGGIRYLKWLLKHYKGDVRLALAGYNAGENAVASYQGIPPYKETQNYVKRILKVYGKKYHPYEKEVSMNLGHLN